MHRSANEAENRKGLVLGLTLAELLLLLLFMLILALSWQITEAQKDANSERAKAALLSGKLQTFELSLAPLIAELSAKGGLTDANSKALIERLNKADSQQQNLADLTRAHSELMAKYQALKSVSADAERTAAFQKAINEAANINPDDPPETLSRALEVLKALGPLTKPEEARRLSEMRSTFGDQKEQIAAIEADREKYRRQVVNLSRSGNGLTLPSCWMTPEGQTQYIFDVIIRDDGINVRDATPQRAADPQMKLVGEFAREMIINERVFDQATARLFAWSVAEKCRFYAIVRDATGATSKQRYKDMRTLVEGHFYPLLINTGASVRPAKPKVLAVEQPPEVSGTVPATPRTNP